MLICFFWVRKSVSATTIDYSIHRFEYQVFRDSHKPSLVVDFVDENYEDYCEKKGCSRFRFIKH